MDQIDVIKRLVAMNPNDMKLVTTADGWDLKLLLFHMCLF